MSTERFQRLSDFAEGLLQASRAQSVHWTQESESSFSLDGQAGRVVIESDDPQGEHPYRLRIDNPEGRTVEVLQTAPGEYYHPWEERLEELFGEARASALDITGTIQRISAEHSLPEVEGATVTERDDIPF